MSADITYTSPTGDGLVCGACGCVVDDLPIHVTWHEQAVDGHWKQGYLQAHAELAATIVTASKEFTPTERAGVRKAYSKAIERMMGAL